MEDIKNDKTARVLSIYTKLMNGYTINKTEEAQNCGVNERSTKILNACMIKVKMQSKIKAAIIYINKLIELAYEELDY